MYEAIVLLPLLGAVIAGIVCLVGAHNRFPGEDPPSPHGAHAVIPGTHAEEPEHAPSAAGSLLAELTTSTFLVITCVLSWFALFDVGIAGHEARIVMFSFISFAD